VKPLTSKQMAEKIGCKYYDLTRATETGLDVKDLAFKTSDPGKRGGQWMWQWMWFATIVKTRKALIDHATKTGKLLMAEGIQAKFGAKKKAKVTK